MKSKIKEGRLWFSPPNKKDTLEDRILEAAEFYKYKRDIDITTCAMNKQTNIDNKRKVGDIKIVIDNDIQKNHFFMK